MHHFQCAVLHAVHLCLKQQPVKESPLDWTGVCSENWSKWLQTALLFSCLTKHLLQLMRTTPCLASWTSCNVGIIKVGTTACNNSEQASYECLEICFACCPGQPEIEKGKKSWLGAWGFRAGQRRSLTTGCAQRVSSAAAETFGSLSLPLQRVAPDFQKEQAWVGRA
jgi:hypothetical protein